MVLHENLHWNNWKHKSDLEYIHKKNKLKGETSVMALKGNYLFLSVIEQLKSYFKMFK